MYNVPTEGSPAGDTLAAMIVVAPIISVILGSFIKPPLVAFFVAILGGGAVLAAGSLYALDVAPGSGTQVGIMFFGGGGAALTLLMAVLTSGSRALARHEKQKEATSEQASA